MAPQIPDFGTVIFFTPGSSSALSAACPTPHAAVPLMSYSTRFAFQLFPEPTDHLFNLRTFSFPKLTCGKQARRKCCLQATSAFYSRTHIFPERKDPTWKNTKWTKSQWLERLSLSTSQGGLVSPFVSWGKYRFEIGLWVFSPVHVMAITQ